MDNKYFCGGPTSIVDIILYDLIKYLPSLFILISIVVYLIALKNSSPKNQPDDIFELNYRIFIIIILFCMFIGYSYLVAQTSKIKEMPIFKNTKNRTKTTKDYIKEYLINYQYYLPKLLLTLLIILNIAFLVYKKNKYYSIFLPINIFGVFLIICMSIYLNNNSFDIKKILKSNGPHLLALLMLFGILSLNLNNYGVVIGLILIISLLDFSYVIEGSLENQN